MSLPLVVFLDAPGWAAVAALVVFAAGFALYTRFGTPRGEAIAVAAPVRGRWRATNSPASRVPSHGIHAWAQTYAMDLVADPEDGSRPGFDWWPPMRRPGDFPGFGEPVLAPVSGEVVRAHGWMRDHWSRNSPLGIAYLILETVRELAGPFGVLGNHVVIRRDDGICVALAHLQQGSLDVERGDRVKRGRLVARCGNSGNSTEPHLHFQVMDRPSVWIAAGTPMRIAGHEIPANGETARFRPAEPGSGLPQAGE